MPVLRTCMHELIVLAVGLNFQPEHPFRSGSAEAAG